MKTFSFAVFEGGLVQAFLHEPYGKPESDGARPCMVVCPGGRYEFISPRETEPPALAFYTEGYNVFILHYATMEAAGEYRPLRQLAETVCRIRRNAEAWRIDPEKIAVMGFSAGGHLAASLGALHGHSALTLQKDCRPDALVLCYPVITLTGPTHKVSADRVTGGREELRERLSVEKQIGPDMPPCFIWHTLDDASVPVENTLLLVQALRNQGVSFAYHLFEHGVHGLSTASREVGMYNEICAQWVPMCVKWLNNKFMFRNG